MTESTPPAVPAPDAVPPVLPTSTAGNRSLAFAIFIIIANIVLNVAAGLALADPSPTAAWIWVIVHIVAIAVLTAIAIAFGVRGLRETAGGKARGRGTAWAGIIIASALFLITLVSTIGQVVLAYAS